MKHMTLEERYKNVKLLAMDFDGVMTDGCVYVDENGVELVKCSRKDGLGILLLKKNNIQALVISKEVNPVVSARCKKLQIDCWQAVDDGEGKLAILKRVAQERGVPMENIAYMGDDLNDLAVFAHVGLAVSVADGHPKIVEHCHDVTTACGGMHAVREVCEKILLAQGIELIA